MCIKDKLSKLIALQTKEIAHTNNSLFEHLNGTYDLLKTWGASSTLCDAGLFHAVYGTDGFNKSLITDQYRDSIRKVIGSESEEIVYLYCSCDRDFFWPKIGTDNRLLNRFTKRIIYLTDKEMRDFCELTVANEIEISIHSDDFIKEYGKSLLSLFLKMKPYISEMAYDAVLEFEIKYNHLSKSF